jgi:hypothetical protein
MKNLLDAEVIVFPGVGAFDSAMKKLQPYREIITTGSALARRALESVSERRYCSREARKALNQASGSWKGRSSA